MYCIYSKIESAMKIWEARKYKDEYDGIVIKKYVCTRWLVFKMTYDKIMLE